MAFHNLLGCYLVLTVNANVGFGFLDCNFIGTM